MATTNLFSRPIFKEGAFTANDPQVRRFAVTKTLDAIDLGAELGADGLRDVGRPRGRRGRRRQGRARPRSTATRRRSTSAASTSATAGYDLRVALEPKPNEPRGDMFLPTVGHALAFIGELEWPDMVGLNPEFAHETMCGLSFTHAVAQTLWHGKLFHIDLNAQRIGKYDQDFRFGSEGIRDAFYLVKLLEDSGWDGMRHFDAHPYRTEDADGVWDFARGCMRTYLILADKARRFHEDPEIQDALARRPGAGSSPSRPGPPARLDEIRAVDRSTRTRSRPRATATSASTSSSPSCSSACAECERRCRSSSGSTRRRRRARSQVRDADTGALVAPASLPHPPTTPPRSEQDPTAWWRAFDARCSRSTACRRDRRR